MMIRYFTKEKPGVGFKIFYPVEEKAKYQEFSCKFETFGLSDNIVGKAVGVDAIDSLINAMMRVDMFLKSSAEHKSGEIVWVGRTSPDDFGLPWESVKRF